MHSNNVNESKQEPTILQQAVPVSKVGSPKVSIIMACHNAESFLAETMDTILPQTLKEWELLIADDASTDQTRTMLEAYAAKDSRIHLWFFDDNKGPYMRRNFMIRQAKAPFICIHDADDLMTPNKLEIFYEAISGDERLGIVGSFDRIFLNVFRGEEFCENREYPITHQELIETIIDNGCSWRHGSAIIRKSLFETIGSYDEHPYGSDSFWLAKAGVFSLLTNQITFKTLPSFLTFIRKHTQSQTIRISVVDPRNRRARFKQYWAHKLQQIIEEFFVNPSMDVARKLQECTCADFIPKFEDLFDQWESATVTGWMVQGLIDGALLNFRSEQYVSAIMILNTLDRMVPGLCQSYGRLNFIRGLAYYAIGNDKQAVANIPSRRLFRNKQAQAFLKQHLEPINSTLSSTQRRINIRPFIGQASHAQAARYRAGYRNVLASAFKDVFRYLNPIQHLKKFYVYCVIRRSGLFDFKYYLKQYPNLASKGSNPLKHYLCYGWRESRKPNELFDTKWYLENYPDVAMSDINPLYHYLKFGWKQNKNPSKDFSGALYFLYNPDAELSGMNPLAHYLKYGQDKQHEIFAVLPDRAKKSVLLSRIQNYSQFQGDSLKSKKTCEDTKNSAQVS